MREQITTWVSLILLMGSVGACIEPFEPDREQPYRCKSALECLEGFTCIQPQTSVERSAEPLVGLCLKNCSVEGAECSKNRKCTPRPALDSSAETEAVLVCLPALSILPGNSPVDSEDMTLTPVAENTDMGFSTPLDSCVSPSCFAPDGQLSRTEPDQLCSD